MKLYRPKPHSMTGVLHIGGVVLFITLVWAACVLARVVTP